MHLIVPDDERDEIAALSNAQPHAGPKMSSTAANEEPQQLAQQAGSSSSADKPIPSILKERRFKLSRYVVKQRC